MSRQVKVTSRGRKLFVDLLEVASGLGAHDGAAGDRLKGGGVCDRAGCFVFLENATAGALRTRVTDHGVSEEPGPGCHVGRGAR